MEKVEMSRLILRAMLATAGLEEVQPCEMIAAHMHIPPATGNMVDVAEAHIQRAHLMAKGQGQLMAGSRQWTMEITQHMVAAVAAA